MSTTLPELLRERQRLVEQIDKVDAHSRSLREDLSAIDRDLSARFSQLAEALGLEVESAPKSLMSSARELAEAQKHRVSGSNIDDWIQMVLMEACKPLRPRQIWEAIAEKEVEVSGKDPVNNISARLSNSDRFVKVPDGSGWWLKGEPMPQPAE